MIKIFDECQNHCLVISMNEQCLLDANGCGVLLIIASYCNGFLSQCMWMCWLGEAKIYEFMMVYDEFMLVYDELMLLYDEFMLNS